jgi:hypothetical protein
MAQALLHRPHQRAVLFLNLPSLWAYFPTPAEVQRDEKAERYRRWDEIPRK